LAGTQSPPSLNKLAQAAGAGCPISAALKGNVHVLVDASLV
jgi:organic hydroperoxide reductase OsmC/OhrA